MISANQWKSLLWLKPENFKHPDKLDWSVVAGLDKLIATLGSRPVILDDWRVDDHGQHPLGRAIDTTWPGLDPLKVNAAALASGHFSGIGVYINESGVGSHHFDTRTDRTPANPATWGGVISHPYDSSKQTHVKRIEYISMQGVIDMIKKKGFTVLTILSLCALAYYLLTSSQRTTPART